MANKKKENDLKTWEERQTYWSKKGKVSPNFESKTNKQGGNTAYMAVPAAFVTLPQDAHVIQCKERDLKPYNGKPQKEVYVLCAGTKHDYEAYDGKVKTVQNWYVARMKYYGGHPGVAEWLYRGTSKRDAHKRFAEIPYNRLLVKVKSVQEAPRYAEIIVETYGKGTKERRTYWSLFQSDGTFGTIVENRIKHKEQYKQRKQQQQQHD